MKKFLLLFAISAMMVGLTGCNDDPQKPVSDFVNALKKRDFQTAATYVHNADAQELAKMEPEVYEVLTTIKPLEANIEGNEATVTISTVVKKKITVKKINNKWLIASEIN